MTETILVNQYTMRVDCSGESGNAVSNDLVNTDAVRDSWVIEQEICMAEQDILRLGTTRRTSGNGGVWGDFISIVHTDE